MNSVTTIIPTKNEALHIERCIASVRELGRVVVVDACSDDDTCERAKRAGADVFVQPWLGHAAQKNWALDNVGVTTEWVLLLDADERLLEDAREKVRVALSEPVDGYYLPRRNIFLGRELKHAWWYPDFQLRLFRTGHARYEEREVHEHMVVDGTVRELWADITHENVKGIGDFIDRHNRYSELEAREIVDPSRAARKGSLRGTWADRRRWIKENIWLRLPGRPLIRFAWLYFLKRGFLDGVPGLLYCALIASYDVMIDAKVYEKRLEMEAKG